MSIVSTGRIAPATAGLACLALGALALASCARSPIAPTPIPPFYQRLDIGGRSVDPASSLSMINEYRGNKGLAPLTWDPALAAVAQAQADRQAGVDKVLSVEESGVATDLKRTGAPVKSFAANFSAGYRTFAEAFSGWRESKVHNATMLAPRATRIGLATAYKPSSKYQIYWALVVVEQ